MLDCSRTLYLTRHWLVGSKGGFPSWFQFFRVLTLTGWKDFFESAAWRCNQILAIMMNMMFLKIYRNNSRALDLYPINSKHCLISLNLKYQHTDAGGTHSLPAPPPCLLNPEWPMGSGLGARFLKVCRYDHLRRNSCYDQLCCNICYNEFGRNCHWTQLSWM